MVSGSQATRSSEIHNDVGRNQTPSRFVRSSKKQRFRAKALMRIAKKTFPPPIKLCFFTLSHTHLGISEEIAQAASLYSSQNLEIWRAAIRKAFSGCCYYAIEVGRGDFNNPRRGFVHAHIIASENDGPKSVKHDSRRYKTINRLEGTFNYLLKPQETFSLEASLDYISSRLLSESRQGSKTRGWLRSKKRKQWLAENHGSNTLSSLI